MGDEADIPVVRDIMLEFADQTGLTNPDNAPRRYLWTDAHAVCTFLSLYDATGSERYRGLALALIDQVHSVLGRYRTDDPREGWISGLEEKEGRAHPTAGGLRIGKELRERQRSESIDERLEWNRDGQYFHYLMKWAHALCRAAAVTKEARYSLWAVELVKAAYAGFVVAAPRGRRLYWKMSTDLTYPLVMSSGHHDPLDGYVSFHEVARSAKRSLGEEIAELAQMVEGQEWATIDPLGIGGLLFDAGRVIQLTAAGQMDGSILAVALVAAAGESLAAYTRESTLSLPADSRLGFRELGLSIGLRAVEVMTRVASGNIESFSAGLNRSLEGVRQYVPLADTIETFWRKGANQRAPSWQGHADINAVTLATSLLPHQFLAV